MLTQAYTLLSLAGIWILFYWLYQDYCLDKFRENLFHLRDELFELALEGKLDFESRAYGQLRSYINSSIRNGHRFGFLEIIMFNIKVRPHLNMEKMSKLMDNNWEQAFSNTGDTTREKLMKIKDG